jgi:AAA ATPase domain
MEGPLLVSNPAAAAGPEGPLPASLSLSPLLSPAVVAAPAEGEGGACASTSSSISCSTGPEEKRRRPSPRGIHERVESHDGPDASNGHNDNNAEIEEEQAPPQDDGPVFLQAIHPSTRAMAAAVIVDNDNMDDKDSALLRTSSSLLDDKRLSSADNDDSRAWDEGTMDQEELNAAVAWRQHLKSCLSRRDDDQARQLLRTYQRLVGAAGGGGSRGPAAIREVILLSGPSGSGKTRLARTLQGPVVTESNGYFLSGKFDKLNLESPAPYTAFGAAFGEFAAAVRSRGTDELQQVRRSIHAALGGEAAVLTRMIPGLEPLCGPCGEVSDPAVPTTKAQANKATAEAIQRFVFVFRTFLRAVATPQRPMVLLLDDIHFAVRWRGTRWRDGTFDG